MTKELKPARIGFQSKDTEEQVWAKAIPPANALWVKVPESNEEEMATASVMVAVEEFLHGEWLVALMYQLAHLDHAANQALARLLTEKGDRDDQDYLEVIVACDEAIAEIFRTAESFVETVDKYQHHRTLEDNPGYKEHAVNRYAEARGEDAAEQFRKELEERIQSDWELVAGKETEAESGDTNNADEFQHGSYVQPVYFRALYHLINKWETQEEIQSLDRTTKGRGRSVAEAVARATLDLPHPIYPLCSDDFAWFDPLSDINVELSDVVRVDELENRYEVTEDEFEEFKEELVVGPDPEDPTELEHSTDMDWTTFSYEDIEGSWVMKAFINACLEVENLATDTEFDFEDPTVEEIRQELVAWVHGVKDYDEKSTMQNEETALLEIPRRVAVPSEEEGDATQMSYPLETIIQNSFESHGLFGVVIYHREEGDTGHMFNWHVMAQEHTEEQNGDNITLDSYHHIPEGIESYKALWEYHWFWRGLREDLLDAYSDCREELIELVKDSLEEGEITAEIKEAEKELRSELLGEQSIDQGIENESVVMANRTIVEVVEMMEDVVSLNSKPLGVIRVVADNNGLNVNQMLEILEDDRIDCHLCDIRNETCGGNGKCTRDGVLTDFEERLPTLVEQLATTELQYLIED